MSIIKNPAENSLRKMLPEHWSACRLVSGPVRQARDLPPSALFSAASAIKTVLVAHERFPDFFPLATTKTILSIFSLLGTKTSAPLCPKIAQKSVARREVRSILFEPQRGHLEVSFLKSRSHSAQR